MYVYAFVIAPCVLHIVAHLIRLVLTILIIIFEVPRFIIFFSLLPLCYIRPDILLRTMTSSGKMLPGCSFLLNREDSLSS